MFRTVRRKSLGLIGLRFVNFACCGTFDKAVRAPIFYPPINNTILNGGSGSRPPVWQQGFLLSVYTARRTTNHPNRNIGGSHVVACLNMKCILGVDHRQRSVLHILCCGHYRSESILVYFAMIQRVSTILRGILREPEYDKHATATIAYPTMQQ